SYRSRKGKDGAVQSSIQRADVGSSTVRQADPHHRLPELPQPDSEPSDLDRQRQEANRGPPGFVFRRVGGGRQRPEATKGTVGGTRTHDERRGPTQAGCSPS